MQHMALLGTRFERYQADPPNTDWITSQDLEAAAVNAITQQYEIPLSTFAQRYLFSVKEADRIVMGARKIRQIQSTVSDWKEGILPQDIFIVITNTIFQTKEDH
ncbi:MAG: hypothetical protein AAGE93_11035 [Bacteroidota bacterium]